MSKCSLMTFCSAILVICGCTAISGCLGASPPTAAHTSGASYTDQMPAVEAISLAEGQRLKVAATTSIVGDVVQNIGGEHIELNVLLPPGTDPHAFQPAPQDVAMVSDAHVLFVNGAGLEVFLQRLLDGAGPQTVIPVSYGIELKQAASHAGVEAQDDAATFDPHTWLDPLNVVQWTHNIEQALSALDPQHAQDYAARAQDYRIRLEQLHEWIVAEISQVPEQKRDLVTDHTALTYFASRYGLRQVGALLPSYSTLAEPSASDVAQLEDAIRGFDVPAIFVESTVNPSLAQRVANDTGRKLLFIYTGALSARGGPADSYLKLMEYDVLTIVGALASDD